MSGRTVVLSCEGGVRLAALLANVRTLVVSTTLEEAGDTHAIMVVEL